MLMSGRPVVTAILVVMMILSHFNAGVLPNHENLIADSIPADLNQLSLESREPLSGAFWENIGQITNASIMFYGRLQGGMIGFGMNAIILWRGEMDEPTILQFEGARHVSPEGMDEVDHRVNYLLGTRGTYAGVRGFKSVIYRELWPGICMVHRMTRNGLQHEFHMDSGTDPCNIRFRCQSQVDLELKEALMFSYDEYAMILGDSMTVPQQSATDVIPTQRGTPQMSQEGSEFPAGPLFSTYVGGADRDIGASIALDPAGNVYVTGHTWSTDFPTANQGNASNSGAADCFVLKLNPTGDEILYSTLVGGFNTDYGKSIAVDSSGNAYVCGYTSSSDFPTVNAYDDSFNGGGSDCFVFKLSVSGDSLLFSTYVGGSGQDLAVSLVVHSASVYVTGGTESLDFPRVPLTGSSYHGGESDCFVFRLNATDGDLLYSVYVGGSSSEHGNSAAINSLGTVVVTGATDSMDFPTTNHYDDSHNGEYDCFLFRLDSTGDLLQSTYVGGSNLDYGASAAVDSDGNIYVTGATESSDFPIANAPHSFFGWDKDVFVLKLNSTFSELLYSTVIGGIQSDIGASIAIDSTGHAYVTGTTRSPGFPVLNAFDDVHNGGGDCFVLKLAPFDASPMYSTYIGGEATESGESIALDESGNIYLTGYSFSSDFPTVNALDDTSDGGLGDCIVLKLPDNSDTDGDGLSDYAEVQLGTNRFEADSDGDMLDDGDEVNIHGTNPSNNDTDSDGMPDGWEIQNGLNATVFNANEDPDSDGLGNLDEFVHRTDPNNDDTDGDGIPDGWEVQYGYDPLNSHVPIEEILLYNMSVTLAVLAMMLAGLVLIALLPHIEEYRRRDLAKRESLERKHAVEDLSKHTGEHQDESKDALEDTT
jgi:hypothetical protein